MIYLLKINKSKRRGLLARLFSRGISIYCERISGAAFCTLSVYSERNIDWMRIASLMTKEDTLTVQKGMKIPPDVRIQTPDGDRARRELLIHGATAVAEQTGAAGAKLHTLLIDRDAEYADIIFRLVKACFAVTVFTENEGIYSAYAEKMLNELGAAPVVINDTRYAPECDIIIAPHGITGCGALPLPQMIFAPSGSDCVSVTAECIDPEDIGALEGFDIFELYDAVTHDGSFTGNAPRLTHMKFRDGFLTISELSHIFYA